MLPHLFERHTMNRCQFNQAIVALGTSTNLPAHARLIDATTAPELEKSTKSIIRIGLASVGGADGVRAADIAQGLPYATRTIAFDTDAFALNSSGADRRVLIGNGVHGSQHPRQAFKMTQRRAAKIKESIDDLDLLIVLAGMYGAAGKGIAPVVAEIAHRNDIGLLGIAIIPADWEGVESNPRVSYAIHELLRAGTAVFPIKSHRMVQVCGDDAPCVSQTVRSLCEAISYAFNQGEIVGIDVDSLRMVFESGCVGAMGVGSASGRTRRFNDVCLKLIITIQGRTWRKHFGTMSPCTTTSSSNHHLKVLNLFGP